jgi:hypothetical protein
MGLPGAPGRVGAKALRNAAATLISDDDISEALSDLNVTYGAIILDSCNSGQALEGSELLGPLSPKGLTGWAYEKGISLLAASESGNPGFEDTKLGAGVLTYALIRDGLQRGYADAQPLDGRVELEEWLRYAAARVSSVGRDPQQAVSAPIQQARFAPARRARPAWLVLTASDREP